MDSAAASLLLSLILNQGVGFGIGKAGSPGPAQIPPSRYPQPVTTVMVGGPREELKLLEYIHLFGYSIVPRGGARPPLRSKAALRLHGSIPSSNLAREPKQNEGYNFQSSKGEAQVALFVGQACEFPCFPISLSVHPSDGRIALSISVCPDRKCRSKI